MGGLAAVDGQERPWLFVRGGLAMALSMAEQGGKPHAVELLNRLRKLYPHVQDPAETIRLYWLEGQLRARLGDVAQARELLVSVRRKYVNQLQLHEAVLATLDVAAVPAPGKQPEESRQLSDELEERFAGAQGLGEILKTLRQQSASPLQATLPKAAEPLRALLIRGTPRALRPAVAVRLRVQGRWRMTAASHTRPFLERFPEAFYWLELGFRPPVAKALVKAGYLSLADLAGKFREDLAAIRGFGSFSLAKCEALLGSPFPSRTEELAKSGIHPLVRNALERAGIRSLAALAKLTREQFLAIPGFGPKGLLQCERALGRPLDSPTHDLEGEGLPPFVASRLAAAGVRSVRELAGRSDSDLRALGLRAFELNRRRPRKR